MDIVKYILLGLGACLVLLFLFLFIPVRYRVEVTINGVSATVRLLWGLWSKTFSFMKEKKKMAKEETVSEEETKDEDSVMAEALEIEEEELEATDGSEELVEPKGEEGDKESSHTDREPKKKRPSLVAQLRFAYENGALQKALEAVAALLRHSIPYGWDIRGRFGTGDPMLTGCIVGAVWATLPEVTNDIEWEYIEKTQELHGMACGRIIPAYALWIVLRTALTKPMWELWKFRKGGTT